MPLTKVAITATDYGFGAPGTIAGGTVELSFTNRGREAHFAGVAKVAPGRTLDDVRAALTAPPSPTPPPGPPPFEEFAGLSTTDPGGTGTMTLNLPPGKYVLYCTIPSSDGTPHAAKGMVKELTVTEGPERALPQSVGTVTATDFALSPPPPLEPGTNVVRLRNEGQQLHEINLVELAHDKTVDDVIAWYGRPSGPPPMRSLGGVAVKPGEEGTAALDLTAGRTYAFVCAIPDTRGDFAPHVTKGMFTRPFSAS